MPTIKRRECPDCGKSIDWRSEKCWDCRLKTRAQNAKGTVKHYKLYPCANNCGKMIRKNGGYCIVCFNKLKIFKTYNGKTNQFFNGKYACRNKCGRKTRIIGGLCKVCLDAERLKLGEARQTDKEQRRLVNIEKINQRLSPRKKEICPKRNGLGHWWILDDKNYGVCKACGKSKNFRAIQQRYNIPQIISAESYS